MIVVAIYAIRGERRQHSQREASLFILGGGVALPTVVLAGLLAYGLPVLPEVLAPGDSGSMQIHVTGKQWWWHVRYATPAGTVDTANEIRLPLGRRIELQLTSPDVIHSFWVPSLAGKIDMIPGRITRIALEPTRTGVFGGVCAEYCGASHARMHFDVVVLPADEFEAWLTSQAQPANQTLDTRLMEGRDAFMTHGCAACHTVRGLTTVGRVGPDLTHVGGRLRIAAGTLSNTPAGFARWIGQTDRFKPGAHMPAFRALTRSDLEALGAYLESLQ
ncbi:MAG: cytochrome c oxidase subunit II [Candidatus Rokuibacteriota bacterium]